MADESIAALAALAYLRQLQPDLRTAAVIDEEGQVLAALEPEDPWRGPGRALIERIDEIVGKRAKEAHIATDTGEFFMIAGEKRRLVAVADRFVLASLLTFDLRTVLRQLEAENAA